MPIHQFPTRAPTLTLTSTAPVDLDAARAIGFDGNYAAPGEAMLGVSFTKSYAGDLNTVDVMGLGIAQAGAAVSPGDLCEVGASGQFIPKASGKVVLRALTGAGIGGKFEALLLPSNV